MGTAISPARHPVFVFVAINLGTWGHGRQARDAMTANRESSPRPRLFLAEYLRSSYNQAYDYL